METLRGTVVHLRCQYDNFCAGSLVPTGDDVTRRRAVTFAGKFFFRKGELVTLRGEYVTHPRWGYQFEVREIVYDSEVDERGLVNWLASHEDAAGIGPVKAEKIVRQFGKRFTDVLKNNPEEIAIAAGIPDLNVLSLRESWFSLESFNVLGTKLMAYGMTTHQIRQAHRFFGNDALRILQEDPYQLIRIDGIGFTTADQIAGQFGVSSSHPSRMRAAMKQSLLDNLDDGSTCMTWSRMLLKCEKILKGDYRVDLQDNMQDLLESKKILQDHDVFILPWLHECEQSVAQFLRKADAPSPLGVTVHDLEESGFSLDESQARAVMSALQKRAVLITGGAGVGKTYILRAIANLCLQAGKRVRLCAPTGKAARRIEEISEGKLSAQTIHRLLEYGPDDGEWKFNRNKNNPVEADLIIVDEVSMVDLPLAQALTEAIADHTSLVLIGDHQQLPPVGPGALLRDAITNELLPLNVLNVCHRQAGILKQNCSAVLNGRLAPTHKPENEPGPWYVDDRCETWQDVLRTVQRLFTQVIPLWKYDPIWEVQFLTPIHKGEMGTRNLNIVLQSLYHASLGNKIPPTDKDKKPLLYDGDKVIQVKNDYELGVMNGTLGVVRGTNPLTVRFDGGVERVIDGSRRNHLELAYALTPHKFQGSEIPCAITICHSSHYIMLHRNWLYTAVTRARKTSVLIGNKYGLKLAAERTFVNQRQTLLPELYKSLT